MSIRPRVRELAPYDFAPHPEGVKLDQNELPTDLPAALRAEFLARLERVALNRYPDLTARELRSRLAELHEWPLEGVVVTPGSNVLIQCLVIAAGIDQSVLVPAPSFGVYRLQARLLGANLIELPAGPGFALPLAAMLSAMSSDRGSSGRGVVFVANPAAPTGNLHPRRELEQLIEAADGRWTIVIDEAYGQFAGSDFADLARRPSVLSLRTLSKACGLAGARVGYALAEPELARELAKTVNPFALSELQQAAALTVLDHPELVAERVAAVRAERERVLEELRSIEGVTAFPSVTNFILLRVPEGARAYQALLDRGVIVRPQQGSALADCLRVTIGSKPENDRFLAALREYVVEVGDAQIG
jgi:histidinol-phosphate aminotransferase